MTDYKLMIDYKIMTDYKMPAIKFYIGKTTS